jgi:crossover junction endodeoxyribonuclease RuvC
MKVLGIDPGTARLGFGVVSGTRSAPTLVVYGCFEPNTDSAEGRLLFLARSLRKLISKERPDRVGLERLFFTKNRKTALAVSEARGVVREVVASAGLPIYEYTPSQVKSAVSVHGRADKREVQRMVRLLLHLEKEPHPDDAADALAVALCCLSYSWQDRLGPTRGGVDTY